MPDPVTTTLELNLPPSLNRPRRVSAPGAFVRVTQQPDGTLLFVAPAPNPFGKIAKAFGEFKRALGLALLPAFRQVQEMAMAWERTMAQVNALLAVPPYLRDAANTLPRIAGLEGRYYVRGALDPRYRTAEALHGLVVLLLDGDDEYDDDLALVTPENRRLLAVAAMRGWSERTGLWREPEPDEPPLILHRLWGSTRVEVHCG